MSVIAKAVANGFFDIARQKGEALTPMKLQKLVYFAHGWHLALKKEPLVSEPVEAWPFGPVFPVLYHEFKHYGDSPICEPATDLDPDGMVWEWTTPAISENDTYKRTLLEKIWNVYGDYSAIQLSNLTHTPGSPWHQISQRYGGTIPRRVAIPNEIIQAYFSSLTA